MIEVSIIMVGYNCEDSLLATLKSITNQTFQNFEVCFVDDGPTDVKFDLASRFLSQSNIRNKLLN